MDSTDETQRETVAQTLFPEDRGRRLWGRLGLVVLWLVGFALFLGAIAVAALTAVVAHGPIEIETAAATASTVLGEMAGPGARAKVGNARLDWSWQEGLAVDLGDISVDRAGATSVSIPRAAIRLQLLPMLTGSVRARTLVLFDPRITFDLVALANAAAQPATPPTAAPPAAPAPTVTPTASTPAPATPLSPTIARDLGRAVDRAVATARREGIETIEIRNGTLEILRTDVSGSVRHVFVPEIDVEAVIGGPAGELDAGFSARGEVGRWSMRLTQTREAAGRRLSFAADDVTHRDLFGPGGPAFELGMPLYPRLTLHFADDDQVDGAEMDLRLGAGEFRFGPMPEDSMVVDEGHGRILWDPAQSDFRVETLYAAVGETSMTLHGRIAPPAVATGLWTIDLAADRGSFRPRDVPGPAVALDAASAHATFDPVTRFLDVAAAEVKIGAAWVRTAGRVDVSGPEPKLRLDLGFSPMDVALVKHVWPHWVAPDARDWVIKNVESGRAADMVIRLDMPRLDHPETWPGNAFQMSGRLEALRFRPLGNLPAVVGADGRVVIADRRLDLVIDKAQVATKWPKRPTVDGLRFQIPDIFVKPPKSAIRFQLAGDVSALAEIVNSEPLAVLDEAGIKTDGLGGTASVTSQIDIVFDNPLKPNSIDFRIEATLDKFSSTNPIQGRHFQDGKFKVVVDPRGLKVTGRAQVDGVVADIDMYEAHGGSKLSDKRDFKMMLDDAARQRIGLDFGGLVQGAIGMSVTQPSQSDTKRRVEVDLTPARLVLAPFGWTKGPGVPAKASLDLIEDDKGVRLENLTVDAEGLTLRGAVTLDKDRRIVSADFTKFALHKGDDARIKVSRGADQAFVVSFDASNFDVRGMLQANRKSAGDDASPSTAKTPDLVLKVRAAKLVGFNDVTLADVGVDGRYRAGAFSTLQVSSRASGGRSLSLSIKPEGDRRRLSASADDAGAVLSFLDLFDRIRAGSLILSARLGAAGVSQGTLRINDFHLLEEPKTGRVAPQRTAEGTQQIQVRRVEINPQTDFSRSSVNFSMRDGVITVTEGVAKGNSVGATASGQLDLNNQRIALTGTYIPAYGLNNLAGRIPVLGAITGAGSNEGLVGVTFRVFGAIDDPILEINPLSAIAPGIFRRIFEFQRDESAPAAPPTNAPTRITP